MRPVVLLLALAVPLAGCSGSAGDADGDGLPDTYESVAHNVTFVRGGEAVVVSARSDPGVADTDGDGLSDFEEAQRGTNPADIDTDGDGLVDGNSYRVDAAVAAERGLVTRADGSAVGERDACGSPILNPLQDDSDRPAPDGIADGDELRGWDITVRGATYRVTSDPCSPDTDDDAVSDGAEKALGTDPRNKDTDADGQTDVFDAAPLENVAVVFTLERVNVKRDAGLPGGELVFTVDVGSDRRTTTKRFGGTGEASLAFTSDVDTDDTATGKGDDGALQLRIPVVVVAEERGPAGSTPFAISGGDPSGRIEIDALAGTWSSGGRSGGTSGTLEGQDGTVHFSFVVTRT